ncbi:MAG: class I SAM-dependent methyltransferase [Treponema sp.]|nr:class I SAM-dependent methyltransferase [Treponema sp.]
MNATNYDLWSQYYDPSNIEIQEINKCLHENCQMHSPWVDANVLEIGCGTGRFTKRIINDVAHITAVDPDQNRIHLLNEWLMKNNKQNKCKTVIGTLEDLLSDRHNSKFNIIIFSWSWAYIDDEQKEFTINSALNLLQDNGVIISTMVEAGGYEKLIYDLCSKKHPEFSDDLKRNELANETLRNILRNKLVYLAETKIDTHFLFDSIEHATEIVALSMPDESVSVEDISKYLKNNIVRNGEIDFVITDIVRCICVRKLKSPVEKAKITFNYKKCDNLGECSAAKECRKYRSAIVRTIPSENLNEEERWDVLPYRCDPDVCGKKCVSVCDLFTVHRFWPEVFEELRKIEKTEVEQDFFDKDRFGSGSYNPDHKTVNIEESLTCLEANKRIQILEISDGDRHASSFDSVLITDLIPQSLYDRCFMKYDIPRTTEENTQKVTLYDNDKSHNHMCCLAMEKFYLDELPALLIISFGQIIYKHQGFVRAVDSITVKRLKSEITNVLRSLLEE